MKSWGRKLPMLFFAVLFLLGVGMSVRQLINGRDAAQANSDAQHIAGATPTTSATVPTPSATEPCPTETVPTETAPTETAPPETTQPTLPPDENTPFLQQLNIPALQAVNPEVIGWIYIPDTEISYPLLHTTDNETYLHTTWDGIENVAGSIFLETQCSAGLNDFNTIIYGHNMRNGSMFATLKDFYDPQFLQAHPYVYIATNSTIYRYAIFSSYEASVTSDTYRLGFKTDETKQAALQHYLNSSVWETQLLPTPQDFILTLSTCTGTGTYETRWVVQAVLDGQWDK